MTQKPRTRQALLIPSILLLGSMYGTTLIASRFVIGQLDTITYLALRLVVSSLAFLLVYRGGFWGVRFPTRLETWKRSTIFGLLSTTLGMNIVLAGMRFVSGGLASILISLGPAFTVVLAHFFLPDEKLTRRTLGGVGIALAGAALLAIRGESGLLQASPHTWLGYVLITLGVFIGSLAVIYQRREMAACDSFQATSINIMVSGVITLLIAYATDGLDISRLTATGYAALFYAALVGTFLAKIFNFAITKRFGASNSSITQYVIPVVASLGGLLLLNETITRAMLVGIALILSGIALMNSRNSIILE